MNEDIRETFHSEEYDQYYNSLDEKIKVKYDYVESIIKTQYVVNKKFVKNLEGTEFYEARVSVGTNEYRTIVFAIDSQSFIESKRVLFLNSFRKKDTKQYKSEIEIARQIMNKYIEEDIDNDEV
ncbi:MAG: type II toxin-antitoxin system RelE/ParE family toxin [Lachnospiraceae bacterium]|nr:type II toxin-antitoxin system RelE/ParE family toxin [Lachnospiraceae bacterium]